MPFNLHNILVFIVPILLVLSGPFWWMKWRWINKIPECYILWLLPLLAFFFVFGMAPHFWDNNYVDKWNDGSYGFMHSAHYLEAYPGGSGWNDLYWIGQKEGDYPINLSYCIIWLGNRGLIIPIIVLFIIFLTSYKRFSKCLGKK